MMPRRIQLKRTKGWRKPTGTVVVSRPSRWGNPYKVGGLLGDVPSGIVNQAGYKGFPAGTVITAEMAVSLYREWLNKAVVYMPVTYDLKTLRGKDLACWCSSEQPCHGDVLLELANRGVE
jgi:hypothetical protein